jgi:hypothetical protein
MIRIFIGTEPAQWLPTEVLKWSVRQRTQSEVEFFDLKDIPLKLNAKMFTGFSFYRYYIPEACHYDGRAIYLDADIVVLADIKGLFDLDMHEKGALARQGDKNSWYTSVMLLDCAKLKHWKIHDWATLINAGVASYKGTMKADPTGLNHRDFGPLPDYWNHLDNWSESTKIIHYTTVPMQPWKVPGHPFAWVFLRELKSAIEGGALSRQAVEEEIKAGHIYPAILQDMQNV